MKKYVLLLPLLTAALSAPVLADDTAIINTLKKLDIEHADIQPSPIQGMRTVFTNNGVLYMTKDGQYLLQGPLYHVDGQVPVNVTNRALVKKMDAMVKDMIIYKAPKEKHVITVFTDVTCGYCHKLHEDMKQYNDEGITVRYLAFPRQGIQSQAEQDMKSVWCSDNPKKALDMAFKGEKVAPATCDKDISAQYALGVQFGVQGTPAIILQDGTVIPGYQGPKEMAAMLDAHSKILKAGG